VVRDESYNQHDSSGALHHGRIVAVERAWPLRLQNALKFAKATGDIPENINFAIKTGTLRDFLDNSVVPYITAGAKGELKTADIARNARAFTLLITCTAPEQSATAKKADD
jgi:hypothetical protein